MPMKRVIEAIGDLGHEELPEPPIAKLGQAQPEPEELEPEVEEFDARDYVTTGNDLGAYLEPMGFVSVDAGREGVAVYKLKHFPLAAPLKFYAKDEGVSVVESVTWANVHVRFDAGAAIPFWRVLVTLGHEDSYFPVLQRVKVVRVDDKTAESMEWVPDAVEAVKQTLDILQQPCRGHVIVLLSKLKQASFKPFNR